MSEYTDFLARKAIVFHSNGIEVTQTLADIEGWLDTPNECPPGAKLTELNKINGINTIGMLADMYAAEVK